MQSDIQYMYTLYFVPLLYVDATSTYHVLVHVLSVRVHSVKAAKSPEQSRQQSRVMFAVLKKIICMEYAVK